MLGIGIDYAIQMHARVEEEVVIDRAAHPIQETARNLGPALLVVTFDAIFAFAALHFAKVPMLREFGLLLVDRRRRDLPQQHHRDARDPRHPRVQVADEGQDFREGALGRLVGAARVASRRALAPALAIASLVVFVGGMLVEGKLVLQTDPIAVGQPELAGDQEPERARPRGPLVERARRVRAVDATRSPDKTVDVRRRLHPRSARRSTPTRCSPASSIVSTVSDLSDVPGATHLTPDRRRRAGRVRRRAARTSSSRRSRRAAPR